MKTFFDQKVVIITGSSMGIGKSLAILLGKSNARIVLNARDKDKLFCTEQELIAEGCNVISYAGDITVEDNCKALINKTIEHYGKIDILVNNAGVSMRALISQISPQLVSTIFKVNAIAPIMLTQMALPYIKQTKGSIIFISSLAGFRGLPLLSIYCATKMSLTAFAQSLRIETVTNGIHVGLVYVGITEIEKGKTSLGEDGQTILLNERDGIFTTSIDVVAQKISKNIRLRKKQSIIGISGKLYFFIIKFFPRLMEILIILLQKRTERLYK